jgi:carbonic anhydrase
MKRIEPWTSFLPWSVSRTTWKGLFLLLVAAATTAPRVGANQGQQQQAEEEVYFSYSQYNDYGPRRWMLLTFRDATNMCDGSAQSPVKLSKSRSCDRRADVELVGNCSSDDMTFAITTYNAKAVLSSSSEESDGSSSNNTCFFVQNDKAWRLLSFHVQLGWEHYFGVDSIMVQEYQGSGSHAELHYVHQNEDGDILVVAVWLEGLKSNADNPTFATLLSQWNNTRTIPENCVSARRRRRRRQLDQLSYDDDASSSYYPPVNPYALIPSNSAFFSYKGSLTTPPCTEGVAWRVYEAVVPISRRQFDWLRDLVITGYIDPATCQPVTAADRLNSTVRPAQHRNGRTISRTCPKVDPARLFFGWASYVMAALAMVGVTYGYRRRYSREATAPKDMDDNPLVPNHNNNNSVVAMGGLVIGKDAQAPPPFITIPSPMAKPSPATI